MKYLLIILLSLLSLETFSQEDVVSSPTNKYKKFVIGFMPGVGWAYEDERNLYSISSAFTIDYHIKSNFFIQVAPQYSWLWRWNEHYLTIPFHLRKKIGNKLSFYAGPALTFDVGHFHDLGLSGGAYYHFSNHSALALSAFSFTLYDYSIDYLYVPLTISYRFSF